jgi:hypothetical protein
MKPIKSRRKTAGARRAPRKSQILIPKPLSLNTTKLPSQVRDQRLFLTDILNIPTRAMTKDLMAPGAVLTARKIIEQVLSLLPVGDRNALMLQQECTDRWPTRDE